MTGKLVKILCLYDKRVGADVTIHLPFVVCAGVQLKSPEGPQVLELAKCPYYDTKLVTGLIT